MGGMWGFRNEVNRKLGEKLLSRVISKDMGEKYNANGQSPKGNDQFFLSKYVWPDLVDKSIIHDSYTCDKYVNSEPFPTQRKSKNYVGNLQEDEVRVKECPVQCRPKDHKDWTFC